MTRFPQGSVLALVFPYFWMDEGTVPLPDLVRNWCAAAFPSPSPWLY